MKKKTSEAVVNSMLVDKFLVPYTGIEPPELDDKETERAVCGVRRCCYNISVRRR
jgi:hypothetical protein